MTTNPIRIAILGGGLAGAAVLQALLRNPNLDVHIFESAPSFREAGMDVLMGQNATKALELMGLHDRLIAAKAIRMDGAIAIVAEGKDTGKTCLSLDFDKNNSWGVSRALLLGALLKDVDQSRLHPAKKMRTLTQQPGQDIVLEFEDGTIHTCDILLGADGIHSAVRKYVVDSNDASATFAGWQVIWTMVSFDAAKRHLGKHLLNTKDPVQYAWCGRNTYLLHDSLAVNKPQTVVLTRRVDEGHSGQGMKVSKTDLYDFVKDYDHPIGRAMVDLVTEGKEEGELVDMFPLYHHSPQAPRYVRDRVAIIGDAADATTPWRGSGAAMSLEDALILGACLGMANDISDARAALKAYEAVRKPRRSQLVVESYQAGLILCGCDEFIGLDAEKMNKTLDQSWEWIYKLDLNKETQKALEIMEAEKKAANST